MLKKIFFNSIFYKLERIPLNKHNYLHELDIIYNIVHKNNFNLNTVTKIHKRIKQKIIPKPNTNIVNYCSMKYNNNLSDKCAKMLNNNVYNKK